ncbi:MAG: thioredoxin family protein [Planctomycetota bacterium]
MSDQVIDIADRTHWRQTALEADQPVAAAFWANWCPFCRRFMPTFGQLAQEFSGAIRFVSVDIDRLPALEDAWRIRKIPTVLLLEAGQERKRWVNEQNPAAYGREFAAVLA